MRRVMELLLMAGIFLSVACGGRGIPSTQTWEIECEDEAVLLAYRQSLTRLQEELVAEHSFEISEFKIDRFVDESNGERQVKEIYLRGLLNDGNSIQIVARQSDAVLEDEPEVVISVTGFVERSTDTSKGWRQIEDKVQQMVKKVRAG